MAKEGIGLSVVISTFDRPVETTELVESLHESLLNFHESHDSSRLETAVIVVCPERDRETISAMQELDFEELEVLTSEQNHAGAGRDIGIRHATTEYVAVIDSDCLVMDDWFEAAHSTLQDSTIDVVQGAGYHDYPPERNWFTRTAALEDAFRFHMGQFDSRNLIFRRETYLEMEGYGTEHEYAMAGDDPMLRSQLYDVGAIVYHDPDIAVYHRYDTSMTDQFRRHYFMGKGAWYARQRFPEHFRNQHSYMGSLVLTFLIGSVRAPASSLLDDDEPRSFVQSVYFSVKSYLYIAGYLHLLVKEKYIPRT